MDATPLVAGQVLEVVGASGVGKTEILYSAVLQNVLPKRHDNLVFDGGETSVLFIDLDYRFSVIRFTELFRHRVLSVASRQRSGESHYVS